MSLRRIFVLVLLPLLVLAACTSDDGGDEEEGDGSEESADAGGTDLSGLPSFETITLLNEQLGAGGVTCALEYEGLVDDSGKEVSICVINGEQAQLTVYPDSETVQTLVDAEAPLGAIAYGQNWTVQVDTEPTAQQIADALGGQVIAAAATGDTSSTTVATTAAP